MIKLLRILEPHGALSLHFAYLYILRLYFKVYQIKLNKQLTVMYTTHGERRLISIRYQKECLESNLDGQSAYLGVAHKLLKLQHAITHNISLS